MRSLITGITGQDGSYLAELLLSKGHEVYGVMRRSSTFETSRIDHLIFPEEKIKLIYGDLGEGIDNIILDIKPALIFNMGAMSHVRVSFDVPTYTLDTNALGPLRILETMRRLPKDSVRLYQASSSEMFGSSPAPQNENTPFHPCSPYGVAKLAAYWLIKTYRDSYKLFACNGILFNHESCRRGENFVTKKIVRSAVRIKLGKQKDLVLGNLEAKRDWGHAKDYMEAIYKIITHDTPDDFVVATNQYYSVKEFLYKTFGMLGLKVEDHVTFDSRFLRPKEVNELRGDPSKIKSVLGWEAKMGISDIIQEMIDVIMEEETYEGNKG